MKAVVAAFNQEKALVGAFSVITNLRMELFEALLAHLFRRGSQEVKVSMLDFLCLLPPELSWARLRLLAGW